MAATELNIAMATAREDVRNECFLIKVKEFKIVDLINVLSLNYFTCKIIDFMRKKIKICRKYAKKRVFLHICGKNRLVLT